MQDSGSNAPRPADPLRGGDDEPIVGLSAVRKTLDEIRGKRVLIYEADSLVPRRLNHAEAVELLNGMGHGIDPCVITARVRGSDMVIRTIEWLGDRAQPSRPRSPTDPPAGRQRN